MATNVLSWGAALAKGYKPGLYPFTPHHTPIGEYEAVLDFKVWAQKLMGINCFFTEVRTGKKFQLTVYCNPKTRAYKIESVDIDFTRCPVECCYKIDVAISQKGVPFLKNIVQEK